MLGCVGVGPFVEIVQPEEQREEEGRHHGEHGEDRLPDPPQHDPPSLPGPRMDQHEEERAEGQAQKEQERHEPREEKLLRIRAPRIAQATAPSRAQTAPMTGMRLPRRGRRRDGGLPGRSATRSAFIIQNSRSSTLRAPSDSSSFAVADGSNRDPTIRSR